VASALVDPLRPKPFRGDVVAAGVVVLVTLVWTVAARFDDAWGAGVHLAYAAAAWVFVTALAVLAPMERHEPRAYQSVLYVSSFALGMVVLAELGRVLGADGTLSGSGEAAWYFAVLAVLALAFAVRRNSAVCTLLGALSAGGAVLAAVDHLWHPGGFATFRYVLLALMVIYGFVAIGQRDRRLRHGVALIDAAGLAVLAIALSFALTALFAEETEAITGVAWGWELLIVAAGFGLIAYSSVDRQPGPAYLGVANLGVFTVITAVGVTKDGATLLGWPLALALAAAALLIIGLRPTTPAPPPPDIDAPEPPPLPLR
jgi:peptidoglycan/LPS O-acetylase OafA/YrhL